MAILRIYGELGRIAQLPKRPGFLINSYPSVVVLSFQPSSFLWQSRSPRMMKRQGLVITTWGLTDDRGPTFGVNGLSLVGVVFFPSSSLVGVVLFPSYAHLWDCARERIRRGRCASKKNF